MYGLSAIDGTMPLNELIPGRYLILLTCTDGKHSSEREEHVVAWPKPKLAFT